MGHNEMLLAEALRGAPRDSVFPAGQVAATRYGAGSMAALDSER